MQAAENHILRKVQLTRETPSALREPLLKGVDGGVKKSENP